MTIARLIADPEHYGSVRDAFDAHLIKGGVDPLKLSWTKDALGVHELATTRGNAKALRAACNAFFADADLLISEEPPAIPNLLVSDMDSTMIGQECIDELADFAGVKDKISVITERAMRGEIDFGDALRERVSLLKGIDESAIGRCLEERIFPTPGAKTLVATLKAHGCRCVLVTGGFHHFSDRVAEWLGFDRVVGNRLEVEGGKLTGKLVGPISDASTKVAVLREEAEKLGEGTHVVASGDGANDIPMLEAADYGFAYRAKPIARDAADGRIESGDLTAILSLLGIPRDKWVEG